MENRKTHIWTNLYLVNNGLFNLFQIHGLVMYYIWSIVYMAQRLGKLQQKYLESFEIWCWRKIEMIKWSEKVTNEEVLEHIPEKRTLLNNIVHRVGHIVKRNWFLQDAIEGEAIEMKRIEGRRRTQLLDDLRNRRCWELKEEAKDKKKMEMTFYQLNIRKKYKLSSISPRTC